MREKINDAMKAAMKGGDKASLSTLRMINAKIKDADIAARPSGKDKITDPEIVELMTKMVKQRRESIVLYRQGNREELAAQEEAEITVIESYLPKVLGDAEAKTAIAAIIAEQGAISVKDMGKVMATLKERFAGQMDFGKAGGMVKDLLK
jgi:uncharacterized protein